MYVAGAKIFPSTPELSPPVKTETPQAGSKMERGGEHSHTPGPWYPCKNTADSWRVQIGTGPYDHIVFWAGSGCPEYFRGDPEANVRLAAAAPEMLDMLGKCLEFLTSVCLRLDPADYLRAVDEASELRALIDKATGVAK